MKSLSQGLFSVLAGLLMCLGSTAEVAAANINTNGTVCQNYNASQVADIDYLASGVRNLNASTRYVICTVPRSPLPSGATSGAFYVDGSNTGGVTTTCTLYSYNYSGTFLASKSFSSSAATYDQYLSLTSAQLPTYAYTSLLCSLPGSTQATLRGVTSLQ